jgi:hypothetical protein
MTSPFCTKSRIPVALLDHIGAMFNYLPVQQPRILQRLDVR